MPGRAGGAGRWGRHHAQVLQRSRSLLDPTTTAPSTREATTESPWSQTWTSPPYGRALKVLLDQIVENPHQLQHRPASRLWPLQALGRPCSCLPPALQITPPFPSTTAPRMLSAATRLFYQSSHHHHLLASMRIWSQCFCSRRSR